MKISGDLAYKINASFLLPFMVFAVAPLTVYYGNVNEVLFSLSDVWFSVTIVIASTFSVLLMLNLCISKFPVIFASYNSLLLFLSISIWVQSQLLVWDFGPLDGNKINWRLWTFQIWIDGIVWLLILALCVYTFVFKKIKKANLIFGFVLGMGLFSIVSSFMLSQKNTQCDAAKVEDKRYKELLAFHPKHNVIIILLDTFQSDYFELILKKFPQEVEFLKGFTFYRNTISRFPTTASSIPSIFTGLIYDNQVPYNEYITKAFKTSDIRSDFINKNYSAEFVSSAIGGSTVPNILSMKRTLGLYLIQDAPPWINYIEYGLFRSAPTFIKKTIYNDGNWMLSLKMSNRYPPDAHGTDIRFVESFEKHAIISDNSVRGTLRIFHFSLPHGPWRVDENLKYNKSFSGVEAYERQARGALKLVQRMINKLHELGIYDSSEIVIMGDHGTSSILPLSRSTNDNAPVKIFQQSLALLLHKKPESSSDTIVVNDAPLCSSDLSCLLVPDNPKLDCSEYHSALQGGNRERKFYFYEWKHEFWHKKYMPSMKEFIIEGHCYDVASWRKGNYTYEAGSKTPLQSYKLDIGRHIPFTAEGPSEYLIQGGWSVQEQTHRWTEGPQAALQFNVQGAKKRDLTMRLNAAAYTGGGRSHQMIGVFVNNQNVANWLMNGYGSGFQWYEAPIPHKLIKNGSINIAFTISKPTSPCQVGNSKDCRKLGFAVRDLVIDNT